MLKLATPYWEEAVFLVSAVISIFCFWASEILGSRFHISFDFLYSNEGWPFLNLMKVYIQPPNDVLFIDFILFKVMIQGSFSKFGIYSKAYQKHKLNSTTLK